MRKLFLMAVIVALFVDVFFYSGAFMKAVYAQLVAAGEYLVSLMRSVIDSVKPDTEA